MHWETEAQASPSGKKAALGPLIQDEMKLLQLSGASDTSTSGKAKAACSTGSPRPPQGPQDSSRF